MLVAVLYRADDQEIIDGTCTLEMIYDLQGLSKLPDPKWLNADWPLYALEIYELNVGYKQYLTFKSWSELQTWIKAQ